MSDSESDEEFLSADEGDDENISSSGGLQEEEVDEIMDMLMSNEKRENKKVPSKDETSEGEPQKQSNQEIDLEKETKNTKLDEPSQLDTSTMVETESVIDVSTMDDTPDTKETEEDSDENLYKDQNKTSQDVGDIQAEKKEVESVMTIEEDDDINLKSDIEEVTKSVEKIPNVEIISPTKIEVVFPTKTEVLLTDETESVSLTEETGSVSLIKTEEVLSSKGREETEAGSPTKTEVLFTEETKSVLLTVETGPVSPTKTEEVLSSKGKKKIEAVSPIEHQIEEIGTESIEESTHEAVVIVKEEIEDDVSRMDTLDLDEEEEEDILDGSSNEVSLTEFVQTKQKEIFEIVETVENSPAIENAKTDVSKKIDDLIKNDNDDKNVNISNDKIVNDAGFDKTLETRDDGITCKSIDKNTEKDNSTEHTNSKNKKRIVARETKDEAIEDKPKQNSVDTTTNANDGWGWDTWADDFIVQAAGKVSTLLETVEGQLGIPDPKDMAQVVNKEEKLDCDVKNVSNVKEDTKKEAHEVSAKPPPNALDKLAAATSSSSGVSSWFSGFGAVTGFVGTELVSGGIGALEFIGKKTVDILSDGDPGLRGKRDLLSGDKKNNTLSAALQEAKLKSEQSPLSVNNDQPEQVKFVDLFEKYQGNAHLDALEMLSSECENKMERILNVQSSAVREESMVTLSETRKTFEIDTDLDDRDESEDFKKALFTATKRLKMKVTCSKLLNTWIKLKSKSTDTTVEESSKDCFESTLACLAELTSRFIEYHRKVADMLMLTDVQAKELALERASTLKYITELFQVELTILANNFAQKLINRTDAKDVVTDIYLEGSNCTSMIKDCHELLLPILQCYIIK